MADRPATTSKKKPGRKRRVAGWLLLVIGVLITGVWGAVWCWSSAIAGWGVVVTPDGNVSTVQTPFAEGTERSWTISFVATSGQPGSGRTGVLVILWPTALAPLLGGGWLVWAGRRARRRAMAGCCVKCGYDLVGLAAGAPCPECGGVSVSPKA